MEYEFFDPVSRGTIVRQYDDRAHLEDRLLYLGFTSHEQYMRKRKQPDFDDNNFSEHPKTIAAEQAAIRDIIYGNQS